MGCYKMELHNFSHAMIRRSVKFISRVCLISGKFISRGKNKLRSSDLITNGPLKGGLKWKSYGKQCRVAKNEISQTGRKALLQSMHELIIVELKYTPNFPVALTKSRSVSRNSIVKTFF